MVSDAPRRGRQTGRVRSNGIHDGFLRHNHFQWLKVAGLASLIATLAYLLIDVRPRPNGGSWLGYALGTTGACLIVWLSLLGVRKRRMTSGAWSLKSWTSAHVYLGLGLIVIATLHTGFQFGLNVHTFAYVLMMLVIGSGIFGVATYATVPKAMSANRNEMTEAQMIESLRAIDRQLHEAAQPLDHGHAELVRASLEQDPFGGGLWKRLSGNNPDCRTLAAQLALRDGSSVTQAVESDPLDKVENLLVRKQAMLTRVRRHLRLKALLEIWLYVHVPLTFALLAALLAHIFSVFFYW